MQDWQEVEDEFDSLFAQKGKAAFVFKFPDAAEVYGRVGKIGRTRAVPSDRIVTYKGVTFYSEIKSTIGDRWKRSLLRKTQTSMATRIIAAGGLYYIFVKAVMQNRWFRLPYSVAQSNASWATLERYAWNGPE